MTQTKDSPYVNPVTKIKDPGPFFQRNGKSVVFTGETLEIRIPKRFEVYDLLEVTEVVTALGIMDLIINGRYQCGMVILDQIQIEPSEVSETTIDGIPYVVLYLSPGDVFIANRFAVKQDRVIYAVYVEFLTYGKPIYFLDYNRLALIFDKAKPMTGSGIGVDRSVFEMMVAHLARDPNDLYKPYRFTDMKRPMFLIPLEQVPYSTTSTSARLLGSYFNDSTAASLVTDNKQNYPFEEILLGLPPDSRTSTDTV